MNKEINKQDKHIKRRHNREMKKLIRKQQKEMAEFLQSYLRDK